MENQFCERKDSLCWDCKKSSRRVLMVGIRKTRAYSGVDSENHAAQGKRQWVYIRPHRNYCACLSAV